MPRTKVFVSYSHDDREWLNRFSQHVAVMERRGLIDVWSDTRIAVGSDWEQEVENALSTARVAVLLISPAFLASEYIWKREMPRVVAHSLQGMDALPLIVRPCAWRLEEDLARLQARPTDGRPLSLGSESQIDSDLSEFAYELAAFVGRSPVSITPLVDGSKRLTSEDHIADAVGQWNGYYNNNRPIRLSIRELNDHRFRGLMEYPAEGTITKVEGALYSKWSTTDPIWAQLGEQGGFRTAIAFREISYEKKGSSSISFDGEYRALIQVDAMTGAWFSRNRLVGVLSLQRTKPESMAAMTEQTR